MRSRVLLPDFKNLGVMLRILVGVEMPRLLVAYVGSSDPSGGFPFFGEPAPFFEVTLLTLVLLFYFLDAWLRRLKYENAVMAILVCCTLVASGIDLVFERFGYMTSGVLKASIVAVAVGGAVLNHFYWRYRALSPALAESRMIALQSRIRPHFLFNSLNTAVSVLREDRELAEKVLLDMTDLFRVVLSEPRALVSIDDELHVAKAYVAIEQLRLGERLSVVWDVQPHVGKICVPVLILQPLLENAIQHGIELNEHGGIVAVSIATSAGRLELMVSNPSLSAESRRHGNGLALANIVERLGLHFDAEARVDVARREGEFHVKISFPVRFGCHSASDLERDLMVGV